MATIVEALKAKNPNATGSTIAEVLMSYNTLDEAIAASDNYEGAGSAPLIIDKDLRTVHIPTNYVLGVYNDKDVLNVPFVLPRYYHGLDLSAFDIKINWQNAAGVKNYTEASDIVVGEDVVNFNWLLGAGVFTKAGSVSFVVCVRKVTDKGLIEREFNTTTCSATVLEGLEAEDPSDPEQYSILVQMRGYAVDAEYYATQAENSMREASSYVGSPLKAATAAEMTNTEKVYVYVGSESGYTNGNWYYYDGSAWVSGGVYNSTAVDLDTELTSTTKPAQGKKVGDEIAGLKADLEQLEPGLSEEAKAALLTCFRHVAFLDEDADYYGDLESALYSGDVVSINATFAQNQNVFSSTDKLSDLIPFLTVTATYGDGTQNTINDYTLSGSLTDGTSVITVSYKAKTTTFPVNVTTVPSGYTMKNYVDSDGIPYMVTQIPETAAVNWWYRLKEMRTGYENRNGHVFSSVNAYTPYLFAFGQAANNRINANRFGSEVASSGTYLLDIWETNIVYEIESFKDNNSIYLNGEEVASVPIGVTMSSNNTFALLGYRGSDGATAERFRFIGRFYYLKIFDNNNRKVHDFVPCINSSNVVGIYDLVDGIFYAPATGTLTAG